METIRNRCICQNMWFINEIGIPKIHSFFFFFFISKNVI